MDLGKKFIKDYVFIVTANHNRYWNSDIFIQENAFEIVVS